MTTPPPISGQKVCDLGPEVAELAPRATETEAAFEKRVPEERREDVTRYVSDTLAGRKTVELVGDEKNFADRAVKLMQDLEARANKAGVGAQAAAGYRAALDAKPDMTLPQRVATFAAETERAKRGAVPATQSAPVDTPPGAPAAPAGEAEAVLLAHESMLRTRRTALQDRAADPTATAEAKALARVSIGEVEKEMDALDRATLASGNVAGRLLRFRQQWLCDDLSFDSMRRRIEAEKGEPLSEQERVEVEALSKENIAAHDNLQKILDAKDAKDSRLAAEDALSNIGGEPGPSRVDILSDRLGIYDGIKAAAKEGATLGEGLDKFVKQLVKNYVDAGERGLENVVAKVREALEPVVPGITPRQVMDAFSDYGKSTPATSKEADVRRAQIRREAQLSSAIADVESGVAPQRKQRSPQSADERQLTARLNEAKRRYNIQPADPAAALRSALDARKTYDRNRMQDLAFEIARKERVIREKSLSPTDAELDSLKAAYEVVKADHEAVFGKREMTDTQRLQQALTIAERNEKIAAEQLANAKKGIFPAPRNAGVKPTLELEAICARAEAMRAERAEFHSQAFGLDAARRVAALTKKIEDLNGKLMVGDIEAQAGSPAAEPSVAAGALKAEYDAMRALVTQLRRDLDPRRAPDAIEARKLVKLNREMDAIQAKIDAGDLSVSKRTPKSETAAVEAMKNQRAAMAKLLADMRRISRQTVMTPEERALKAYKTRLAREEADLADRHAKADAGDPTAFAKRVRKPIDISQDPAAVAAKARVDKGKEELIQKELAYKLKNWTLGESINNPIYSMNRKQLSVMWIGIGLLIAMWLFPPWNSGRERNGYDFLFTGGDTIAFSVLAVQSAIVILLSIGLIVTVGRRR